MRLRHYLKLMKTNAGMQFSSAAAYRFTFITDFLTTTLRSFLLPIITVIIYSQTNGFPGWSMGEFILFQGTMLLSFAIAGMTVFSIVWNVGDLIDRGSFDKMLISPLRIVPAMISFSFSPWFIQDILSGLIIVLIGLVSAGWVFNLVNLLMYFTLIISSLMIWFFIAGLIVFLNFKYPNSSRLIDLFFSVKKLGDYPINLYGSILQFLLTFVLPFSIAGFYPAQAILGRITDFAQFSLIIGASFVFGFIGYWLLNKGVKNYESVGG